MRRRFCSVLSALLVCVTVGDVHGALNVAVSQPVGMVEAQVAQADAQLNVVIRNVADDSVANEDKVSFPSGFGPVSAQQYLQIGFQANVKGAAVIISTDNRSATANPRFPDSISPSTGASGAGLVGMDPKGHGFTVPLFWVVFDETQPGGYAFTGNPAVEAYVTDKAQTHTFAEDPNNPGKFVLTPQPFDSTPALAYASIVVGMSTSNGVSNGLIASFPTDVDGSANGNNNGLRSATSPVAVYLGADYRGAPAQKYATNTLTIELIYQ